MHISHAILALSCLAAPCAAQGAAFTSPGSSGYAAFGQTDRFDRSFNPAFGMVVDLFADYTDSRSEGDGFDLDLRLFELNAAAFVDPDVWAFMNIVADGDEINLEEVAVEYIGFEGNTTVKLGRFFVDFGKQMQMHPEELRTLERPLVLREFLGEELSGTGIQVDHWVPVNDTTPLRFSLGVFASLLSDGHGHGEEEEGSEPETAVPDQKSIDELSFTTRITAMTDAGENGIFQAGVSGRFVPEFSASFEDLEQEGLSNYVYGADVTYVWNKPEENQSFLIGGEALLFDGDLSVEVDDPMAPTLLTVTSDEVFGYFVFSDFGINQWDNVGVQFSAIEQPEMPSANGSELDFYFTRHLTEMRRLRFGVTVAESELESDSVRFYVQFTNFFGNHAHGLNW